MGKRYVEIFYRLLLHHRHLYTWVSVLSVLWVPWEVKSGNYLECKNEKDRQKPGTKVQSVRGQIMSVLEVGQGLAHSSYLQQGNEKTQVGHFSFLSGS